MKRWDDSRLKTKSVPALLFFIFILFLFGEKICLWVNIAGVIKSGESKKIVCRLTIKIGYCFNSRYLFPVSNLFSVLCTTSHPVCTRARCFLHPFVPKPAVPPCGARSHLKTCPVPLSFPLWH